jgi:hypothetical protein
MPFLVRFPAALPCPARSRRRIVILLSSGRSGTGYQAVVIFIFHHYAFAAISAVFFAIFGSTAATLAAFLVGTVLILVACA